MTEIKLYTVEEIAELLKLSKRTIYSYIHAGELEAVKVGRFWRVPAENLAEFTSRGAKIVNSNRRKENQLKEEAVTDA